MRRASHWSILIVVFLLGAFLSSALDRWLLPPIRSQLDRPALVGVRERLRSGEDPSARIVDVTAFVLPSVVSIEASHRGGGGKGSGIVFDESGHLLTNRHVVVDQGRTATELLVTLADRRLVTARLVGTDELTDLAVLKIDVDDLWPATLGDSSTLRAGEGVVAIGNGFGLDWSVSRGIVSALGRTGLRPGGYESYIQTDAAINPGNSGGPLVNLRGEVIGVNSLIRSDVGQSAGVGFAIPIRTARYVAKELIERGHVQRALLGVNLEWVGRQERGALTRYVGVGSVHPGSAAAKAGVREGDLLLSLNGHPIERLQVLRDELAHTPPGTRVELEIFRERERATIEVQLGAMP